MVVVARKYIDFLIIIITYLYSTCISSFFGSSVKKVSTIPNTKIRLQLLRTQSICE